MHCCQSLIPYYHSSCMRSGRNQDQLTAFRSTFSLALHNNYSIKSISVTLVKCGSMLTVEVLSQSVAMSARAQ